MNKKEYLEKITRYFGYLLGEIKCNIALGLLDINTIAEDFYIPILSYLYDCKSLENKNTEKPNYPAIDLGCKDARVSFQVTSDNSSSKVAHTLKLFREHNLDNKYDEVYVLIITDKQKSYTSEKLNEEIKKLKIDFDIASNIIDYNDLLSRINNLDTDGLKVICEILEKEFNKQEIFNLCRGELDNFLLISNKKIEEEKQSKKYIPSIFTETTKIKDIARLFVHPLFFYRKIYDQLNDINYKHLNKYLEMMGVNTLDLDDLSNYLRDNIPDNLEKAKKIFINIESLINNEKSKVSVFGNLHGRDIKDFEVEDKKKAIKSILKHKREMECWGIEREFDKSLDNIKACQSKILLVTSMAGQGKTNFVCDLVERLFKSFDIPSLFIPARELNHCNSPLIHDHITKNRYLSKIKNQYELLEFFNKIAKEINKPFIIVIDGINELNDLGKFNAELKDFLKAVCEFDYVKIIITCRSEFFDQKFSDILKQSFSDNIYHVKNLKSNMSQENLDRVLQSYLHYFNIKVELGEDAKCFLKDDLLLLRIFCELNHGKDIGCIDEIYKDKLYEKYLIHRINGFDEKLQTKVLPTLHAIARVMINQDLYSGISMKSFDNDQSEIIEKLVYEDIVLRRELSENTLGTIGDKAVGFTYDELRDFVISYYLINELVKSNFTDFRDFMLELPKKTIYEGVFKYVYILSKKNDLENVIKICETMANFEDHYVNILYSIPPEYLSSRDIDLVKGILSGSKNLLMVSNVACYLYKRKNIESVLSIKTLVDYMNSLNDKELYAFVNVIFSGGRPYDSNTGKKIDNFTRGWVEIVEESASTINIERFKFYLQVSGIYTGLLSWRVIDVCVKLKEKGVFLDCFDYIKKAKAQRLNSLASSIEDAYKEKTSV